MTTDQIMTKSAMTTTSSSTTRINLSTRTSTVRVEMTTIRRFAAVVGLVLLLLQVVVVQAVRRDPLASSSFMVDGLLAEEIEKGTAATTSTSNRLLKNNVNVPIPKSPNDHLVTDMPLLENVDFKNTKHWSGLLPVNEKGDGYLFYWLFEPDPTAVQKAKSSGLIQDETKDIPLVIWLNGTFFIYIVCCFAAHHVLDFFVCACYAAAARVNVNVNVNVLEVYDSDYHPTRIISNRIVSSRIDYRTHRDKRS